MTSDGRQVGEHRGHDINNAEGGKQTDFQSPKMIFSALIGEYKYSRTLGEVAHFVLVFNIASIIVCSGKILLFKIILSEGLNHLGHLKNSNEKLSEHVSLYTLLYSLFFHS